MLPQSYFELYKLPSQAMHFSKVPKTKLIFTKKAAQYKSFFDDLEKMKEMFEQCEASRLWTAEGHKTNKQEFSMCQGTKPKGIVEEEGEEEEEGLIASKEEDKEIWGRRKNFSLMGNGGLRFPTDRTIVWGDHCATHHNPAHWLRAEEFLPGRWIVAEGDELYPPKNGWRSFERGPRNCIGQEVAMTEIKLMLALTIRDFDFKDAYEEYDVMKGNPKGLNVNGQRAYMMFRGGGHPADHYPCKVALAKQT